MGTIDGMIWGVAITFGMVMFAFLTFTQVGHVTITSSFQEEYNTCQEQLKTATTPQCAPVVCKDSNPSIIWELFGVILWITGLLYWNWYGPKQAEKKNK